MPKLAALTALTISTAAGATIDGVTARDAIAETSEDSPAFARAEVHIGARAQGSQQVGAGSTEGKQQPEQEQRF